MAAKPSLNLTILVCPLWKLNRFMTFSEDLGASFSFIFLLLFGVALLLIPVIGIFLGTGVIGFTVFLMCGANKEDKDFEKSQNQKAQKNFEIRLSHYENLMKQARYYQSHLDSFTRSRDDSIIDLKTVKKSCRCLRRQHYSQQIPRYLRCLLPLRLFQFQP